MSDRIQGQRRARRLFRQVQNPLTMQRLFGAGSVADSPTGGSGVDRDPDAPPVVTPPDDPISVTLHKFVVGHPVYGAIPADPDNDPVWEL